MADIDPTERLLSLLASVRVTGENQYLARCPAHEDAHASLSVSRSDSAGSCLVKCQAGCETSAVLNAIGLTMKDLFPSVRSNGTSSIVAEYDYRDAASQLLYQVIRFNPKDFRQRKPNGHGGYVWKLGTTPRVLFRLPELLAADPSAWVFVVEGEKDVLTLAKLGLIGTCNPGGAEKWNCLSDYSALHGRRVCIITDRDDPGRRHGQDVAARLQGKAAMVRVIEPLGTGKDISDWLDHLPEADDRTPEQLAGELIDAAERAREWMEGTATKTDPPPRVLRHRTIATIEARPVSWLWDGYIARRAINLVDGDPGLGKSWVTLDLAARVSRGWRLPPHAGPEQVAEPADVIILNDEDDSATTIRPRLEAAGADLERVHFVDAVAAGDDDSPVFLPQDLDLIEQVALETMAAMIVFDPLMAYFDSEVDAHKDSDVRRVMRRLKSLAERTESAVVMVRHLNKLVGVENAVYRGGGSIGIVGAARSALLVGKHPDEPDKRILARTKGNLSLDPAALVYSIESGEQGPCVCWHGEVDLSADDLVTRSKLKKADDEKARAIKADGSRVLSILDAQDNDKRGMKVRDIGNCAGWGRPRADRACFSLVDSGICEQVFLESKSGKGKVENVPGIRRL